MTNRWSQWPRMLSRPDDRPKRKNGFVRDDGKFIIENERCVAPGRRRRRSPAQLLQPQSTRADHHAGPPKCRATNYALIHLDSTTQSTLTWVVPRAMPQGMLPPVSIRSDNPSTRFRIASVRPAAWRRGPVRSPSPPFQSPLVTDAKEPASVRGLRKAADRSDSRESPLGSAQSPDRAGLNESTRQRVCIEPPQIRGEFRLPAGSEQLHSSHHPCRPKRPQDCCEHSHNLD